MLTAKKLIEVALPLDAINKESAREKSIRHGHPSTLHLWWARRPLAAARAVIFTSLVEDPADEQAKPAFVEACRALPGDGDNVKAKGDSPRMRLFDFIERLVTWEATTDEAIMGQARQLIQIATGGAPPALLDPFAGGGSIPLEAQRLGLEAHASDLNPVAVMINKAMIEIPPRFAGLPPVNPEAPTLNPAPGAGGDSTWKGAAGLAADLRYYGEWMRARAFERIGHLYPAHKGETVIAWLWARTVTCPNPACTATAPLVSSFALSKKKGREYWARPVIEGIAVRFEVTKGRPPKDQQGTMIRRRGSRCIVCDTPLTFDYMKSEGRAGRMGAQLMAIVTEGKRGRNYHSADEEQVRIAESATAAWEPIGSLEARYTQALLVPAYGLTEWSDLFTPRQLTALTTFSDLVRDARELAARDALAAGLADDGVPLREGGAGARAYGEAVSVYLAFAVDRAADYGSSLCIWDSRGHVQKTFGRQALPMVWDFAESNPFGTKGIPWVGHLFWICKNMMTFPSGLIQATAIQANAQSLDVNDLVPYPPPPRKSTLPQDSPPSRVTLSTDPPYYDNIGYADLSDYLYVWLRRNLRDVYPELFSTLLVPKAEELIASRHRHGGKAEAKAFFESGMLETFRNLRNVVTDEYPQTVYYAFKQQDAGFIKGDSKGQTTSTGWETMLTSLIDAGFSITGTWPMRTEQNKALKTNTNALSSSIILVCRPRPADAPASTRRRFLDALRAELPAAIAEMKTGSIAPVDMAQATIGPGMAIYSRYRAVLEADGAPLTVRAALGLINAALDEALEEQDAQLDLETRFAIGWFEQGGFREGDFGQADVLARGKNTSVESVVLAGLVEAQGGKVRLIHWREYDPGAYDPGQDKRPTVWEGSHHLIERLNHHGEEGAAALYSKLPAEVAESARDLAYRLYHICDRKGWAEDALDYNGLVSSWSEITRLAARERSRAAQPELFDE